MPDYKQIAPFFNVGLEYDPDEFNNPLLTIEGLIQRTHIAYKIPDGINQYRSLNFGDLKLHKIPSSAYANPAIPLIYYFERSNTEGDYIQLYVVEGDGVDYSTTVAVNGTIAKQYLYYQGIERDDTVSDSSAISNYIQLSDEYNKAEWLTGKYGTPFEITTNLPVFKVTEDFNSNHALVKLFLRHEITPEVLLSSYAEVIEIVNTVAEKEEKIWYVYNEYIHGKTDLLEGFTPDPQGILLRQYEQIKARGGTLSMVRQSDGTYKIMNDGAEIIGSFYGTHTIYDLTAYPNVIHVDSGFIGYWDKRTESASITCATRFDTNMYYYRNEQDYNDVISGVKKPKDVAENYDEIDKGQKKENNTGEKDKVTVMGKPDWSNIFVNQWLLTFEQLRLLAMSIYPDPNDSDQLEKIQKGISAIFSNPIDAISDLAFYPIDIRRIATLGPTQQLHIAGVAMNVSSQPIAKCSDTLVMGEYFFEETEKNYKNYYTQSVQIWLPYIGMKQLDIRRLMGKKFRVEYAFDLLTHQCTAFLFADDILVDYYPGEIGINMPITATNFAQYASNYINLIGSATGVIAGAAANPVMGAAGALPMSVEMVKTMNINNYRETKGGVTSGIAAFSPQYVYLLFEQLESEDDDDAIRAMRGWPSNSFGRLEEFGGFLSVTDVELDCTRATESEKAEIESLLRSGIRI